MSNKIAEYGNQITGLSVHVRSIDARVKAIEDSDATVVHASAEALADLQQRMKRLEQPCDKPTQSTDGRKRDWEFEHYLRKQMEWPRLDEEEMTRLLKKAQETPVEFRDPPTTQSIERFDERRRTLITYLHDKVREADWHGVSDAANDLRVLEARAGRQLAP